MVKTEFIQHYGHTWRLFKRLVEDFDANAWLQTGVGQLLLRGWRCGRPLRQSVVNRLLPLLSIDNH